MTDLHHQHGTTVVEEREGAGTALMVILAVAVIAFLIWLFAFSGAFGGDDDPDVIRNDTTQTQQDPPAGTTGDEGTTGDDTSRDTNPDSDTDTTTP